MRKQIRFVALLLAATVLTVACSKEKLKPSISEGVYGVVTERYGDWFPGSDGPRGERPYITDVYIYEYTKQSDIDCNYFFRYPVDSMPKPPIATTSTDSNGFYQISLPPGKYSLLIMNYGLLQSMYEDDSCGLTPVTVFADTVVEYNFRVNNCTY